MKARRPQPAQPIIDPLNIAIDEDEPWDGAVVNIAATLDGILHELKRYVVAKETELATAAVWCAHSHLVHHTSIRLTVSPRLGIQAPTEDSGKTTTLEIVCVLSARGILSSSFTAASVFRIVDAVKPSLCIDETDRIVREKDNPMLAVLNGSHRRTEANVWRVEKDAQGRHRVVRFSSWAAIATAGIGVLPRTLQSRSVVITLRKALG